MSKPFAMLAVIVSPAGAAVAADPIAGVLLSLVVILVAAKVSGELAVRLGQPAVLGELCAGMILGNLTLLGFHGLELVEGDAAIQTLAHLGVILLLFEVGLESTVEQMRQVGVSALLVAMIGVVVPFALGWAVGAWFLPGDSALSHAFLGTALSATSIGITARVLKDLGRSHTAEARIVLGAAVLDDVLGLVILAIVVGATQAADAGRALSPGGVALVVGKAAAFLGAALLLGMTVARRLIRASGHLRTGGALLATGLAWCFGLSYAAHAIGLAPIVGAFAAGLVLEPAHWQAFTDRGQRGLDQLVQPLSSFLVPIFFVTTGMHIQLADFADVPTVLFALVLTIVAVVGKQVSALGAISRGARLDRLSIGIGMIPRGEVGLIFANLGGTLAFHGQPLLSSSTFSALVIVVMITTLITPPLLKISLARARDAS